MEEEPNDVIVLSTIGQGSKNFNKIRKKTGIEGQELNTLLERLENKGFIVVIEKKGFFGPKKEIVLTEKGAKELEERKFELEQNWNQLVTLWKSGDRQKLQQYIDDNRSIFPAMMFMGIMDMMMFSSLMSFMGLAMTRLIPDRYMNDVSSSDIGHDGGQVGSGGDFGHADGGSDMGGFDVNF